MRVFLGSPLSLGLTLIYLSVYTQPSKLFVFRLNSYVFTKNCGKIIFICDVLM